MGSEFTFYDYVDEHSTNLVHPWLLGLGDKGRATFDIIIINLAATPSAQWSMPAVRQLVGPCGGLWELRAKIDKVQRRLLGFFGPGRKECTLLFGAIEKGGKFDPASACQQALNRRDRVRTDPKKHGRKHEFGSTA